MLEILFWIFLAPIVYVYAGYPLIIWFFSHIIPQPVATEQGSFKISIIIPAYNEEKVIRDKIKNVLNCGYPRDLMEVIVASDASTDRTEDRAGEFQAEGVMLIRFTERLGKSEMINQVLPSCKGEIVIISDADTRIDPGSIPELISRFTTKDIGAACGRRSVADTLDAPAAIADGIYCRYEGFIKKHEGLLLSIMGADGSLYAFRRELFAPVPADVPDDFSIILHILSKKMGVVYVDRAISRQQVFSTLFQEYRRKTRTISRGIRGVIQARSLLNPLRYPLPSFQLISHKILRWLLPIFLLLLFVSNLLLLGKEPYSYFIIIQIAFYIAGGIGLMMESFNKKIKLLLIPAYFSLMNIASLSGIAMWISGKKQIYWNKDD